MSYKGDASRSESVQSSVVWRQPTSADDDEIQRSVMPVAPLVGTVARAISDSHQLTAIRSLMEQYDVDERKIAEKFTRLLNNVAERTSYCVKPTEPIVRSSTDDSSSTAKLNTRNGCDFEPGDVRQEQKHQTAKGRYVVAPPSHYEPDYSALPTPTWLQTIASQSRSHLTILRLPDHMMIDSSSVGATVRSNEQFKDDTLYDDPPELPTVAQEPWDDILSDQEIAVSQARAFKELKCNPLRGGKGEVDNEAAEKAYNPTVYQDYLYDEYCKVVGQRPPATGNVLNLVKPVIVAKYHDPVGLGPIWDPFASSEWWDKGNQPDVVLASGQVSSVGGDESTGLLYKDKLGIVTYGPYALHPTRQWMVEYLLDRHIDLQDASVVNLDQNFINNLGNLWGLEKMLVQRHGVSNSCTPLSHRYDVRYPEDSGILFEPLDVNSIFCDSPPGPIVASADTPTMVADSVQAGGTQTPKDSQQNVLSKEQKVPSKEIQTRDSRTRDQPFENSSAKVKMAETSGGRPETAEREKSQQKEKVEKEKGDTKEKVDKEKGDKKEKVEKEKGDKKEKVEKEKGDKKEKKK